MKIDIMTLFPEMINAVMRESIIGRAQDKGVVEVKATNIRDYALDIPWTRWVPWPGTRPTAPPCWTW